LAETTKPKVEVKLVKDFVFKAVYPGTQGVELTMDERPPLGSLKGPNASRVLASAIANCLSASLLFCFRKSRLEVEGMEAEAEPTVLRNEEGYWRVGKVDVRIRARLRDGSDREKVRRCIEIFEKYCVVTEAVRNGIPVSVGVDTGVTS